MDLKLSSSRTSCCDNYCSSCHEWPGILDSRQFFDEETGLKSGGWKSSDRGTEYSKVAYSLTLIFKFYYLHKFDIDFNIYSSIIK